MSEWSDPWMNQLGMCLRNECSHKMSILAFIYFTSSCPCPCCPTRGQGWTICCCCTQWCSHQQEDSPCTARPGTSSSQDGRVKRRITEVLQGGHGNGTTGGFETWGTFRWWCMGRWLSARVWYLQFVKNGDTAVLCRAIKVICDELGLDGWR